MRENDKPTQTAFFCCLFDLFLAVLQCCVSSGTSKYDQIGMERSILMCSGNGMSYVSILSLSMRYVESMLGLFGADRAYLVAMSGLCRTSVGPVLDQC